MKKPSMRELRDMLLTDHQNLKEAQQGSSYIEGYRNALKNIINIIEIQMMPIERQIIIDVCNTNLYCGSSNQKKYDNGENFYDSTLNSTENKQQCTTIDGTMEHLFNEVAKNSNANRNGIVAGYSNGKLCFYELDSIEETVKRYLTTRSLNM